MVNRFCCPTLPIVRMFRLQSPPMSRGPMLLSRRITTPRLPRFRMHLRLCWTCLCRTFWHPPRLESSRMPCAWKTRLAFVLCRRLPQGRLASRRYRKPTRCTKTRKHYRSSGRSNTSCRRCHRHNNTQLPSYRAQRYENDSFDKRLTSRNNSSTG